MGRVFDAIRKSSAPADNGKAPKRESRENERRNEAPRISSPLPSARDIEEQLFAGSTIMTVSGETARSSASSAHTADVPDGSALPGGIASRDAGATLDAAGAARAGGFVTYDISPARVEPHLVAISQPRSAYCEQFRALRTRILQAAERTQMRAIVVTSRSEEHTSELQSLAYLVCRLLLEKKKQHLAQERLELVVGPVHLVDEQHRPTVLQRLQHRPGEHEARVVQALLGLLDVRPSGGL